MLMFDKETIPYFPTEYGLGIMPARIDVMKGEDTNITQLTFVGHEGADYGSGTSNGYNFEYDLSFGLT